MQDFERPDSFLRRLLWKNSGVLCLATLITLPIILGVALGYFIVLAFVTSYRKMTGKKSREEKENEASKKIRIVLGQDLLDTAFTKPEELPGQRPKFLRPLPKYGSVNDEVLSSDGSESDSETETEDESIDVLDEKSLTEIHREKEDIHEKVEAFVEIEIPDEPRSQAVSVEESQDDVIAHDVTNDERESDVIDDEECRTTSASSGHYSTASEMVDSDGRESRGFITPTLDTRSSDTTGESTQEHDTLNKKTPRSFGPEILEKSVPDVADSTVNESGYFEENMSLDHSKNQATDVLDDKTAQTKHPGHDLVQPGNDSGHPFPRNEPAIHSVYKNNAPVKITPSHDCNPTTKSSSCHEESLTSLGKLKYSVQYMRGKNELQVTITKAVNLFHENKDVPLNSFVKVSLLPQRFCWQKTKTIQETKDPVFNETFVISGFSHERFSHYTLLISVVNAAAPWQGFYGDHVIGELYVPLSHVAKYSSNQQKVFTQWAELKPKLTEMPKVAKCGKINMALCYRPISGRLIVTIKKAKELECESKEKFDPYVKLSLYCCGSRVGRGATRVKRKVTSPVFNEKFNFDLNADQIAYTTIVIKVMNNINNSHSSCTGATVIGYESSENGQEHWLCMMKCLSKHVDAWHNLYS